MRIILLGVWPKSWREHWIVPLFKKGAVFLPKNYRGVHLTAQISKVCERVIKKLFMLQVHQIDAYGENKFAYTEGRGARDVLAYLMIEWILTLNDRGKVIVYNSDVSGAFDRVPPKRLISKLQAN